MADVRAVKTGSWSDVTVWNTGALPTASDDVWANTFTVTIDTSPTVLSVRNGTTTNVTTGGTFVPNNGITLTCTGAGVVSGNNAALAVITSSLTSGQSCTVTANLFGGVASNAVGLSNTSTGTVNIIGNVSATTQNSSGHGARNTSSGTINITGNCTGGGSNSGNTFGVRNESSGTVNITGNCFGGANNGVTAGVANDSLGVVNITGTVNGGSTNQNNAGAINTGAGILTHVGNVQSTSTSPGIGPGSLSQVTILSGPFLTVATGINPVVALRWFWANSNVTPTYYQIRTANFATIRPLYTADSVGGVPAASNVRSGTVYGPAGELTGTCAVPGASSVLAGVPVDATTGTATISAADIRAAVGLASANLDAQFAAIPAAPSAAAIRTEMDSNSTKLANLDASVSSRSTYAGGDTSGTTTLLSRLTSGRANNLDNLDATVSSRLASSGYTAPLDAAGTRSAVGLASANLDTQLSGLSSGISGLPSASAIATAVWAAATRTLTTAIDNSATIANAVWSYTFGRTITGGTVDTLVNSPSVPSASQIASQVRVEITPELNRMSNAATTQEVADIVEGAVDG